MSNRFWSNLRVGLNVASWPTALIAIVVIKAVLSLAVRPGSFLVSYSGISYLLLLLLATSFAIRNGIQNTLGSRPFWVFLAVAYGFWAMDQFLFVYYQLALRVEVPNNSIADSLLFLHTVPLMAAVATLPHRDVCERQLYRAILNSLFLLVVWIFLYGYIVFPYQYLFSGTTPSSYAMRFDILYLLENVLLVLWVSILTLSVQGPWKAIYFHLLGAAALYSLSSIVANLAIDSGGYVNGKLYGLGLIASVCWFVWIPLRARQAAGAEITTTRSAGTQDSQSSQGAMLVVVIISIPIVWELFQRNENTGLRTLRLLIAVAAILCLASVAYIKEYLARRELASCVGLANDRLHLAMQAGTWVGWDLDVKSGRDLWFGDLQTIFGIPADRHATTVAEFIGYVHPDDRQRVSEALADAERNRRPYAQEFRILQPDGTIRWLAARGKYYFSRNGDPRRMVGVSLDITERRLAEDKLREYEKVVEGSEEMIAVVDREYRYLIANRKFLRLRNMTKEQVVGHFAYEVLNEGVFEAVIKEKLDECFQGKVVRFEMKYTYPELGERDVLISYFPIEGASGVDRVACIVLDITVRKQLEKVLTGMSRKLIQAQEQERARIARELHENINQRLALLAIEVGQIQQHASSLPFDVRNRVHELQKQTAEISTDLYSMGYELHSSNLEYLGIVAATGSFCREFAARQTVKIAFSHDYIPQAVSREVSLCLFRILQEALHNAAQHSKAKYFEVKLGCSGNQLQLTVTDQGIGFDAELAMIKGGLGLISMGERVRLVNGTIAIESKLTRGTTIRVRVPLRLEHSSEHASRHILV
jgi:PAS domain S-box-containing protein